MITMTKSYLKDGKRIVEYQGSKSGKLELDPKSTSDDIMRALTELEKPAPAKTNSTTDEHK
ncbi:MAG: hypothetical protein ACYC4Q_02160 [Victivallaceae bacterium]